MCSEPFKFNKSDVDMPICNNLEEKSETAYYAYIVEKRNAKEQRRLEEQRRIEEELLAAQSPEEDIIYPRIVRKTFTPQQISFFYFMFNIYKDEGEFMLSESVKIMVRSLYYNPTEAYLKKCMKETDYRNTGLYDHVMFLTLMAKIAQVQFTEQDLIEAFKTFDADGSGIIKSTILEMLVTTKGERLNQEEFGELLQQGDIISDNNFNYVEIVQRLNYVYETIIHKRRKRTTRIKNKFMRMVNRLLKEKAARELEERNKELNLELE